MREHTLTYKYISPNSEKELTAVMTVWCESVKKDVIESKARNIANLEGKTITKFVSHSAPQFARGGEVVGNISSIRSAIKQAVDGEFNRNTTESGWFRVDMVYDNNIVNLNFYYLDYNNPRFNPSVEHYGSYYWDSLYKDKGGEFVYYEQKIYSKEGEKTDITTIIEKTQKALKSLGYPISDVVDGRTQEYRQGGKTVEVIKGYKFNGKGNLTGVKSSANETKYLKPENFTYEDKDRIYEYDSARQGWFDESGEQLNKEHIFKFVSRDFHKSAYADEGAVRKHRAKVNSGWCVKSIEVYDNDPADEVKLILEDLNNTNSELKHAAEVELNNADGHVVIWYKKLKPKQGQYKELYMAEGGDVEVRLGAMSSSEILDLANTVSYYDRIDYSEPEITDLAVAKKYLRKHFSKTATFADGGTVVAKNILKQIGGAGRVSSMTGAYDYIAGNDYLSFKIKNRNVNYVKIKLNSKDLYDVELGRIRAAQYKVVKEYNDVWVEDLIPILEEGTGMYFRFKDGVDVEEFASGASVRHSLKRKSPTDSATAHPAGTKMEGNDGNIWEVRVASNGVPRWTKINEGDMPRRNPAPEKKSETSEISESAKKEIERQKELYSQSRKEAEEAAQMSENDLAFKEGGKIGATMKFPDIKGKNNKAGVAYRVIDVERIVNKDDKETVEYFVQIESKYMDAWKKVQQIDFLLVDDDKSDVLVAGFWTEKKGGHGSKTTINEVGVSLTFKAIKKSTPNVYFSQNFYEKIIDYIIEDYKK